MKQILEYLFSHQSLDKPAARAALSIIGKGEANSAQMAAFMTVFLMRQPSVEELEGFREALLELCLPVDLQSGDTIDLCGTGGDSRNTFNISTIASFVVAGAGIKVAKHGNYGVSSVSGSSNVMEHLGYKFSHEIDSLKRQVEKAGICFLHAPLFHPAMKNVAPIRKELGVKTFFNMLGPLVNPARPKYQSTGVYSLELARIYRYILQRSGNAFRIIHAKDGYDEISLTSDAKMFHEGGELTLTPAEFNFQFLKQQDLFGGSTVEEAGKIFLSVLNGTSTEAQKNVVLANAAVAISCAKNNSTLLDSLAIAKESLDSKKALQSFIQLINLPIAIGTY